MTEVSDLVHVSANLNLESLNDFLNEQIWSASISIHSPAIRTRD
jgi:hypothetical protein